MVWIWVTLAFFGAPLLFFGLVFLISNTYLNTLSSYENIITHTPVTQYQEFTPYAKVGFTEKLILDKKYCDINKSFNRFYIEMNLLTENE